MIDKLQEQEEDHNPLPIIINRATRRVQKRLRPTVKINNKMNIISKNYQMKMTQNNKKLTAVKKNIFYNSNSCNNKIHIKINIKIKIKFLIIFKMYKVL